MVKLIKNIYLVIGEHRVSKTPQIMWHVINKLLTKSKGSCVDILCAKKAD